MEKGRSNLAELAKMKLLMRSTGRVICQINIINLIKENLR